MATPSVLTAGDRTIATSDSLTLAWPRCKKGIGSIIASPAAANLIEGVRVQPIALWPDDRGFFLEVQRIGQGLAAHFPANTTQFSAAVNYPGIVKAFHYHLRQTDCWTPVGGMLQVALVDLREGSKTFGARNTFYVGSLRPWQILIPPGVGHGYKVIGREPSLLVYMTDRFYDPGDEGRIPHNDPHIQYDWETQHK
jgi:dTDP-4-dehydrorhamnose 3,5-epimerase